jgi:hypothetical protein
MNKRLSGRFFLNKKGAYIAPFDLRTTFLRLANNVFRVGVTVGSG